MTLTRREALKLAALGATTATAALIDPIRRAAAIAPEAGTTFYDAEHVVILMQENRSFDHLYGTLRGVRGFDDPRAITLPSGDPVWVQSNYQGERYVPFRFDLKDTKAVWMGALPHSWPDQVDARHGGLHDRWLIAKASGERRYAHMPLTLGYYDRRDVPFYYELADAFTICDQNFCSSLTATTPNRSYLWTGTIRPSGDAKGKAHLLNSNIDFGAEVQWTTFPERLEDHGISWKIYQNELYVDVGFQGEEGPWLSNFGDNPLEYFLQFNVQLSAGRRRHLKARVRALSAELDELKAEAARRGGDVDDALRARIAAKAEELAAARRDRERWSDARFQELSPRARSLHEKAFCTNSGDPHYHELDTLAYYQGGVERTTQVPKGDLFYQFRKDVNEGNLPAVSWLVAPERFSDHPSSAWYGAWYIAEAINILIQNPKVWQKTIFILTYDENDGYFDHVPPFTAPHPGRPESGAVSAGIDAAVEYVDAAADAAWRSPGELRDSPIGLGYRVPLVIASPWSRGGYVCSQVFDHTSPLQFLEKWLSRRTGRDVKEHNISAWRRTVCGDLTSAFRPAPAAAPPDLDIPNRDQYVALIHQAQFKDLPAPGTPLSEAELLQLRQDPASSPRLPHQEPGQRPSCALPYDLAVDGSLGDDGKTFTISFAARKASFATSPAGAPFIAYARLAPGDVRVRNYTVAAGDSLDDSWSLRDFEAGCYDIAIYGPNGFYRHFRGAADAALGIKVDRRPPSPAVADARPILQVQITNAGSRRRAFVLEDVSYGAGAMERTLDPRQSVVEYLDLAPSYGWYDLRVRILGGGDFEQRYAGRLETGVSGWSDPAIGRTQTAPAPAGSAPAQSSL